ncbi:MAG: transcription termination/antitermination protein NusG [Planctomycetota bacterium]|nr:MAG: transcription termination/antitermination protein NusG [Planctomycetota bacterium]
MSESTPPDPTQPAVPAPLNTRWFVLRVASNMERKMRDKLEQRVQNAKLDELLPNVLVPTETVTEMKGGKKRTLQKKLYPGYIMVEMALEDDGAIPEPVWFLIRETQGIGDFVGSSRKQPVPMEAYEVERILNGMRQTEEQPQLKINFKVGDRVKINDGPFESYSGHVDEVNEIKGMVRVIVTIFGRETPVELEYWKVEKT